MTLRQFFQILGARWLVASALFVVCVAAAVAYAHFAPRQYTAIASVVVDPKLDPIAGAVNPDQAAAGYLLTQVDILSSERVAERVVKLLKLDEVPAFKQQWQLTTQGSGDLTAWLAGGLLAHETVTPSRDSNVISIAVKWPSAQAAAAIANAFAQAYLDTSIELKVGPAKQYANWFDERSRELRSDLEAKQQRLSDFQKEAEITATDSKLDIESARLVELSSQLTAIQAQRQDSQSRQRQVQGDNETLPEVLQSQAIAGLKANLAIDEAKLKNIATNLGTNHPEYQATEAEIVSLRDRIAQETAKVVTSMGSITQSNLRRESDLRAALEAQKQRVLALKHNRDELDVLQNDVNSAQHNLDTVTQRLSQSSLESQIQQANVQTLTVATEPLRPSTPKVILVLLTGVLGGAVVSVGAVLLLELISPRIRSEDELARLLSVPLLGRIGGRWIPDSI
jgi:chain length determinant protein EpsF